MFVLKDKVDAKYIVGWNLDTGKHGVFKSNERVQQALFTEENDAWDYMYMLESVLKINVSDLTVEEI